jgi:hypothetical protein
VLRISSTSTVSGKYDPVAPGDGIRHDQCDARNSFKRTGVCEQGLLDGDRCLDPFSQE